MPHPSPTPRPAVIACCGNFAAIFGLERMTFEVLNVVLERGGRVHYIFNDWASEAHRAVADRTGASWSTGRYHGAMRRSSNPLVWLGMAWDVLLTSAGLLRDHRKFGSTHVFVPEWGAVLRNWLALLFLRLGSTEVVLRLGNAPEPGAFNRRLWRYVISPAVDRFVCNSDFTRKELVATGIPGAKTTRIYNSAPMRHAAAGSTSARGPRDPGKLIYVGQIIPPKGLDLLLEAMELLTDRGRDYRLDVVGPVTGWVSPRYGNYRDRLLERANQPGLAERVRFLGHREDVPLLMATAAVHVLPSRPEQREAFGVVIVEAKLAAIPSIVTVTGAPPELVRHKVDGWICETAEAASLAEAIDYFLSDEDRCRQAGREAKESAAGFSHERFADAWAEIFER